MENIYIVKESRKEIKSLVKEFMRNSWQKFFGGVILYLILSSVIADLLGIYFPKSYLDLYNTVDQTLFESLPSIPFVTLIYALLIGSVLSYGKFMYSMNYLRTGESEYALILEGVNHYLKALGLYFITSMIVGLGLFLFIIPGVIMYYNYKQAYFLLVDDPTKGIMQCLKESTVMMRGNRMKLFEIEISMLGLMILAEIPVSIIFTLFNMDTTTVTGIIIYYILRIPVAGVFSYLLVCQTVFYELLIQKGFENFKYSAERIFAVHAENNNNKEL